MKYLKLLLIIFIITTIATAQEEKKEKKIKNEELNFFKKELPKRSWRETAIAYFTEKEYKEAILYFRKWLQADPKDHSSWYNLACAYSLSKDKKKAMDAFEMAIEVGWKDASHSLRDSDLTFIHKEPRFLELIEQCKKLKLEKEPIEFKRHMVKMESFGSYIVMLPRDYYAKGNITSYPICVILHGLGSSELNHGKLADAFGREGVIYIAVRYPYPFYPVFYGSQQPGWSAYPMDKLEPAQYSLLENLNAKWIFACVDDARTRYRIKNGKISLLGHSQGSFMANLIALNYADKINSYLGYAGGIYGNHARAENLAAMKKNGVKAFLVHCKDDKVVKVESSTTLAKKMKDAQVTVTLKLFEKGGHVFSKEVKAYIIEWLDNYVRLSKQTK